MKACSWPARTDDDDGTERLANDNTDWCTLFYMNWHDLMLNSLVRRRRLLVCRLLRKGTFIRIIHLDIIFSKHVAR